jgi:hypothetical protein
MPGVPYLGLSAKPPAAPIPEAGARAFGLPEKIRGRACIMQLDDGLPKLDLTEFEAEAARPPSGNADLGLVRLCLASPDLQADYARLTAEGVPFLSPPQTGTDGLADIATCVDPDGTCIELIQIYPDKWASLSMR